MALYGFHKRFVPAIERGDKRHTIRKPRTGKVGHVRPGGPITLKHGSRFKPVIIGRTTCEDVLAVTLDFTSGLLITQSLDAAGLPTGLTREVATARGLERFAESDGFETWDQMRQFWHDTHGVAFFKGYLIKWRFPLNV